MSTTVTYKDNILTTVNNNTKTLKTAGKYMEDDVTLVDVQNTFIITPTYIYDSDNGPTWTIDKTYDEVDAAYKAGKTIVVDAKIYYDLDTYDYCDTAFWYTSDSSYTISIA